MWLQRAAGYEGARALVLKFTLKQAGLYADTGTLSRVMLAEAQDSGSELKNSRS